MGIFYPDSHLGIVSSAVGLAEKNLKSRVRIFSVI
jgi:hypothetical protein